MVCSQLSIFAGRICGRGKMPFIVALVPKEDYDNYDYFLHHLEEYKDGDINCYIDQQSCVISVDGQLGGLKAM